MQTTKDLKGNLLVEKHNSIKHTWLFYNIRSVIYDNKYVMKNFYIKIYIEI